MTAEHGDDYTRGKMDISQHQQTYRGFMAASKWLSLGVLALVLWLTLWFAVGINWFGAAVASVVALVAGYFFIRFFFPPPAESH